MEQPDKRPVALQIAQRFQLASAKASSPFTLSEIAVTGDTIEFQMSSENGQSQHYTGKISGDQIDGTVMNGGNETTSWRAVRVEGTRSSLDNPDDAL